MGVELNLYETFIKKLNELFFILNLKFNGEENTLKLSQESFSKFLVVKLTLEKMIEKSVNTYINDTDTSLNSSLMNSSQNNFNNNNNSNLNTNNSNSNFTNNILENEKSKKIEEWEKIKLTNNLNDLLNLDSNSEKDGFVEPLIKHLGVILRDFLGKLGLGYSDLLSKYAIKKENKDNLINLNNHNFTHISMENLLSQKLLLEKLLMEKDKIINSNNNYNLTGANSAKDSGNNSNSNNNANEALIAKLNEEKKKLEVELEQIKSLNTKNLTEIKMLVEKLSEQKKKYEDEISKIKKSENKENQNQNVSNKDLGSLYTIDECIIIIFLNKV